MSEYDAASPDLEPSIRLREPADLVDAVPYLLGFHPRSSLVVVGLAEVAPGRSRVTMTARVDIADFDPAAFACDGASPEGETAAKFADHTAAVVAHSGATRVCGVVFAGLDDPPESIQRAMRCAGLACEKARLNVDEWLVASDDASVTARPSATIATQAAYAGLVARPDRSALVALLEPLPAVQRERLRADLERTRATHAASESQPARHRAAAAVRAIQAASRTLFLADDVHVVRFGAALADDVIRDRCWLAMEAGRLEGENFWRELARRLPAPWDAPALFLFAWCRWRHGDGALAGIAARRALDSDPGYRAAILLDAALLNGMNPFVTPPLQARTA